MNEKKLEKEVIELCLFHKRVPIAFILKDFEKVEDFISEFEYRWNVKIEKTQVKIYKLYYSKTYDAKDFIGIFIEKDNMPEDSEYLGEYFGVIDC